MAYLNGRKYLGVDISETYVAIAEQRIEQCKGLIDAA